MDKNQVTIWVARDKDKTLSLFKKKPSKVSSKIWSTGHLTLLPTSLFPSVRWEDDELTEMEIELNKWIELMGWCPSQCYYYFMDGKVLKCIYLRWRWADPWTVDLITFPSSKEDWGNAKWEGVDLGYFRDEEYKRLQKKAVRRLVKQKFIYKIKRLWQRKSNASTQ